MPRTLPQFETITRDAALSRIREALLPLTSEESSMCKVAAQRGIFCQGFDRFSDAELRARYSWIVRKRPDITREELEDMANVWQLTQQDVKAMPLACDVQTKMHDTCQGWHDFTNEQLAFFIKQLTGDSVRVEAV